MCVCVCVAVYSAGVCVVCVGGWLSASSYVYSVCMNLPTVMVTMLDSTNPARLVTTT